MPRSLAPGARWVHARSRRAGRRTNCGSDPPSPTGGHPESDVGGRRLVRRSQPAVSRRSGAPCGRARRRGICDGREGASTPPCGGKAEEAPPTSCVSRLGLGVSRRDGLRLRHGVSARSRPAPRLVGHRHLRAATERDEWPDDERRRDRYREPNNEQHQYRSHPVTLVRSVRCVRFASLVLSASRVTTALVAKEYVLYNNPRAADEDLAEEMVRMLVRVRRHLPRRW